MTTIYETTSFQTYMFFTIVAGVLSGGSTEQEPSTK